MAIFSLERPASLTQLIDDSFTKLVSTDCNENWLFSGHSPSYRLCNIDEHKLAEQLILDQANRTTFYFLDVGAGCFGWVQGLAKHLNRTIDPSREIEVHIIGVRGEAHELDVQKTGICTTHRIGAFKIEEIGSEFKRLGYDLEDKIDLIVSRWTLNHLIDPLRTVAQIYPLLQRNVGCFIFDGFPFNVRGPKEHQLIYDIYYNLIQTLIETQSPFLVQRYDHHRSLYHYVLKRAAENPFSLRYSKICSISEMHPGTSGFSHDNIISYERDTPPIPHLKKTVRSICPDFGYGGDKDLFEELKAKGLLVVEENFTCANLP